MKARILVGVMLLASMVTVATFIKVAEPPVRSETQGLRKSHKIHLRGFDPEVIAPGCSWVIDEQDERFTALTELDLVNLDVVEIDFSSRLKSSALATSKEVDGEHLFSCMKAAGESVLVGSEVACYLAQHPERIPKHLIRKKMLWEGQDFVPCHAPIVFLGTITRNSYGVRHGSSLTRERNGSWRLQNFNLGLPLAEGWLVVAVLKE